MNWRCSRHSFNQMTAQLEENRRRIEVGATELREKNLALEERRNYIETVLESLTTGVVSLDESNHVTTINAAAVQILKLSDGQNGAPTLDELIGAEDFEVLNQLLNARAAPDKPPNKRSSHGAQRTRVR